MADAAHSAAARRRPRRRHLAEETLTRALQHTAVREERCAPSDPVSTRGWLATIARNLTRGRRRALNSSGESPVRLTGLGAGHFRVTVGSIMDANTRREFEVTVDGEHDSELELDLR